MSTLVRSTRREVADGVSLAVEEHGGGPAVLVLVHGFGNSRHDWTDVVGALADDVRVVTYDQRGHGDSTHTGDATTYTLEWLAHDLTVLLRDVGPATVLGSSLGGVVALRTALASPALVTSLILVNTAAEPTAVIPPAVSHRLATVGRTRGMAVLAGLLDGMRTAPGRTDAHRARFRTALGRMDLDAFVALGSEMSHHESLLADLGLLSMPVTVLAGEHDAIARSEAEAIGARLPRCDRRVLPDAGHAPHEENAADWLAAVRAHLATTAKGTCG